MPEYRNFLAYFDGGGISTIRPERRTRLTDKSIYGHKKTLIFCTLGVHGLQVWTVAANTLNKYLTRGGPPISWLGQGLTSSDGTSSCYEMLHRVSDGFLGTTYV